MSTASAARFEHGIPQPKVRPLVGNLPDLGTDAPVQAMMALAKRHGPLFRLTLPTRTFLVASSYAVVEELCDETRFDKFVHGPLRHIRDFAGDGLFTADTQAPNWGKAHRILMPAFGPTAMKGTFDAMVDVADQMLTKWARLGPGVELDVPDQMTRLTLDTIALAAFGYRFNSFYQREMHPFVEAMVRSLAEAGARSKRLPLHTKVLLLGQRQYQGDIAFMNRVVDEVIAERRRGTSDPGRQRDLLDLMLEGRDPVTGEGLDDLNVRHQMVTFLIAGHETTSGLLSFALHLLLTHPEVLEAVRAEVDAVLGDSAPRFEQVSKLRLVDQVLRESLRLWPTAPAFALAAKAPTTLAGAPITPDEPVLVLTPMLHRDPSVWGDDVERFDPSRFEPSRRAALPENAWKPFGHGQRACIGRPFAMQEATLVLAMVLQRFDLEEDPTYRLQVKETLTLKPEGLTMRVHTRKTVARPVPAPVAATPVAAAPVASHGTPLLVLFGSNTGASESFARSLGAEAAARGYAVQVEPMDSRVGALPTEGAVLVVTASYNGTPPDNAKRFCAWLESLEAPALRGVRYAVFGCGHSDWAKTYQRVPAEVDAALGRAGATRLHPRGEADARGDFFGAFEGWSKAFAPALDAALGVEASSERAPLYTVRTEASTGERVARAQGLRFATVTARRELVDVASPFGRSKQHVELELPEGLEYQVGDSLLVLPENPPALVARAARRFGLELDAVLTLEASRPGVAALPVGVPVSVRELLGRAVELSAPATVGQLERLAALTACPPHAVKLRALAADHAAQVLAKRVSVLELLEQYEACTLGFAEWLEMLPASRARQYSIASSAKIDPRRCVLTVAVVRAPAWSGRGEFEGVGSTFLARVTPGDRVAVSVRTPSTPFHPPRTAQTPVVMVCAGTGLAPFRGFVEERAALGLRSPALLFFGCDHPDVDFLYRSELEAWEAQGVVSVRPAFFRAPRGEVTFVQHRLWEDRAEVQALLDKGAHVFVCGDGSRLAPAVRETMVRLREDQGVSRADAEAWLEALIADGRYVVDAFG